MKKKLVVPKFKNEGEEADFWSKLDLSEYFEPSDFKRGIMFPNLKPTTERVTMRVPSYMLNRLKVKANAMDVPYQSLIKQAIDRFLKMS